MINLYLLEKLEQADRARRLNDKSIVYFYHYQADFENLLNEIKGC